MIKRRRTSRTRSLTRTLALIAFVATLALVAAGCGGDDSDSSASDTTTASGEPCDASIGVLTVLTGAAGPQGREMLHWAQLAVDQFNEENGTDIKVVEGDDQLDPAQAATVAQQWASNPRSSPSSGPSRTAPSSRRGRSSARPGMAMVSSTATSSRLTEGKYPTFYRVTPPDSLQGSQDAQYMIDNLKVKKVFVIDDQSAYSKGIADVVVPKLEGRRRRCLEGLGQPEQHRLLGAREQDLRRHRRRLPAVDARRQCAAVRRSDGGAGEEGDDLRQRRRLLAAGLPREGVLPLHVLAGYPERPEVRRPREGVRGSSTDSSARSGSPRIRRHRSCSTRSRRRATTVARTPDVAAVAENVKNTNIQDSVLGQPIEFESNGEMKDAKFYVYTIKDGKYVIAPS